MPKNNFTTSEKNHALPLFIQEEGCCDVQNTLLFAPLLGRGVSPGDVDTVSPLPIFLLSPPVIIVRKNAITVILGLVLQFGSCAVSPLSNPTQIPDRIPPACPAINNELTPIAVRSGVRRRRADAISETG